MPGSGSILGNAVRRLEDPALLTGTGRYVDDLVEPNMAHVAFVRSTVAHANLGSVDVAEAYRSVRTAIVKSKGRIMGVDLDQKNAQQVVANLTFAIPREGEAAVRAALPAPQVAPAQVLQAWY